MPLCPSIEQRRLRATTTPSSPPFSAMPRILPGRAGLPPHRGGKGVRYAFANIWEGETRVSHRVTLIPGDGTGPEIAEATRRVLEGTGVTFDWDVQDAGADVMDRNGGNPLPDQVIESIRHSGTAIKGPITTPVGTGFRSVNVGLRKSLDMYAQVRPC